jgi:hypothetical protein
MGAFLKRGSFNRFHNVCSTKFVILKRPGQGESWTLSQGISRGATPHQIGLIHNAPGAAIMERSR